MFTISSKEDLTNKIADSNKALLDTPQNELPHKYDLGKCIEWIRKNNYQKICLQFPGHLLNDGTSIALYLQKALGRPVYILADTSYGSCCVDEVAAEHVNGDSIIHFGHACLSPVMKLPVLYVFEKEDLDVRRFHDDCQAFEENVIIFYDDVFHHLFLELCSAFENKTNVSISQLCSGHENVDSRETICGRMYTRNPEGKGSAVYIGNESVTLQNLVLGLPDLKWYRYSKEGKLEEYNLNRNKFLMQRSHLVEKIKAARALGILIGTLGIKNYLDAVNRIKMLAKQNGKKCYVLAMGKPNVAKLANFSEIDVFVYIACQGNLLLKEFKDYYRPVVSLFEVEVALSNRPYSLEYTSDFRQLLPGGSFYKETKPDSDVPSSTDEVSQELMKKDPGTMTEYVGAQFLTNRTWRGLERNEKGIEVCKAVEGRSGIPQSYENELETLLDNNHS